MDFKIEIFNWIFNDILELFFYNEIFLLVQPG